MHIGTGRGASSGTGDWVEARDRERCPVPPPDGRQRATDRYYFAETSMHNTHEAARCFTQRLDRDLLQSACNLSIARVDCSAAGQSNGPMARQHSWAHAHTGSSRQILNLYFIVK